MVAESGLAKKEKLYFLKHTIRNGDEENPTVDYHNNAYSLIEYVPERDVFTPLCIPPRQMFPVYLSALFPPPAVFFVFPPAHFPQPALSLAFLPVRFPQSAVFTAQEGKNGWITVTALT